MSLTKTNTRMLEGNVPNSQLENDSITINGSAVALGGSTTIATGGTNTPAFDVRESGLQNITHNVYTNLTFGTELTDTDNAFSSNTFTVPSGQGGIYFLGLQVQAYSASGVLTACDATLWKGNNNTALSRAYNKTNVVTHLITNVNCVVTLQAGDVIGGAVTMTTNNSSGAQSYGGDQGTRLYGFKLA